MADEHLDLRLVIAGPEGPDTSAVRAAITALPPPVGARVIVTGALDAGVRRSLLESAALLAYPSLYEGFGFPPLEAMSVGVPVLAGRAGSLPEVAGPAALLVDPLDTDALADAMRLVLTDSGRRSSMIAAGSAHAARFTFFFND